jgi:hypothetical protein
VVVTLLVGKPPCTWHGSTIVGPDDQPDGIERTAVLRGKRLDVKGQRITVMGKLRVIDHPGRVVGTVIVPAWVEIRIEE